MDQPLVSILITAYNTEPYIKEAIDSALAQTYKNIEVLVLVDSSTDRTLEIAQSYTDPRVRVFKADYRSILLARNQLLAEAKGEYFAYLDSDDVYLPDKIVEELTFLQEHTDCALVYCNLLYFFDGQPDVYYHHHYKFYSDGDVFQALLDRMFITNTAILFRRSVYDKLGGYNESLGIVEDWEYFLRMTYAGYRIAFMDKDLVRYRVRWNSNTNFARQVAIKESGVKIFEDLKQKMGPEERKKFDIDRHIADRKEALAIALLSAGKKKEAMQLLGEIKQYVPFGKRVALRALTIVPTSMLEHLIERAWNARKRKHFVPIVPRTAK